MPHDQIWKILLWEFPAEFLRLFFPDEARRLDVSTARAVDKEVFTDLPEGARREPDVLFEVDTRDGETEIVLVHVEVQSTRDVAVSHRMWEYYSLLRLRMQKPVFAVAFYLAPGVGGLTEDGYEEQVLGRRVLTFRYAVVGVADLLAADYEESDNLLAPALSALMRAPGSDRVLRKLRALERLLNSSMNEARRSLLRYVVDKYLSLSDVETARYGALLKARGLEDTMGVVMSWEDYLVQRGVVQGMRRTLLELARARFGDLPAAVVTRLERTDDPHELEVLTTRIATAQTLDEMGLGDAPGSR